MALDRLGLDRDDLERRLFERSLELLRLRARADVETRDLLAVGADQTRRERRVRLRSQMGEDRPIFARNEFFDLELAVADDAQRDGLDAAGGARARQFAPEHRREVEADEIIERAARAIGVDQRFVDLARMAHRILDRLLGDGVEDDAIDALVLEQLLALENFVDMPGDRLALAVGVGREDDAVGALDCASDVAQPLGGLGVDLPAHGEIIVRIDRTVLGGEVADMAERGVDVVAFAQIFIDGFGLGRRFDDHDLHTKQSPGDAGIWANRREISREGGMDGLGPGKSIDKTNLSADAGENVQKTSGRTIQDRPRSGRSGPMRIRTSRRTCDAVISLPREAFLKTHS